MLQNPLSNPPVYHAFKPSSDRPAHSLPLPLRLSRDPATLSFLNTPTTELAPIQPAHERNASATNHTLPSLSSVTSGLQQPPLELRGPEHWPSLNPFTAFYTPSHAQPACSPQRMNTKIGSASPERYYDQRSRSVTLDDPDVRLAAEALGDLRAGTS
jgi:hypothetical protein